MPADAVHLGDVGAGAQQLAVDFLLVGEADAVDRRQHQGRSAPGDQADKQVVGTERPRDLQQPAGRLQSGGIRHGMRCLDDFDLAARAGKAVSRDDQSFERAVPGLFEGFGHGGGRLAGADHHRPALGAVGQGAGDTGFGPDIRKGGVHQRTKESGRVRGRFG